MKRELVEAITRVVETSAEHCNADSLPEVQEAVFEHMEAQRQLGELLQDRFTHSEIRALLCVVLALVVDESDEDMREAADLITARTLEW